MKFKKLLVSLIILAAIALGLYLRVYPQLKIVTGYNAKILCSCVFVSGLDQDYAEENDLGFSLLWLATNEVNHEDKTVESSVLGMQTKKAVYRPGLGCTLLSGVSAHRLRQSTTDLEVDYAPSPWPDRLVEGSPALQAALQSAFDTSDRPVLRTRAVAVIKNGRLIGEAYADGFNRHTPLLGWSMTKSLTAALIGILVHRGDIDLDDPLPIEAWQDDERAAITWATALHMESGLAWTEDYSSVSPATTMLYEKADMGRYAESQPLEAEPGTHWEYSSGTTNILARALRHYFPSDAEYQRFPVTALFGPLGARSFVIETDASGHFVGSSYGYATARDWARLGQLFLDHGRVGDRTLIDSSFVEFCRRPSPHSQGRYGGHFWLNDHGAHSGYRAADYWMNGFQGQRVSIHPEENLIIVRLGVTYDQADFDFDGWTGRVIAAAMAEDS